MKRKGQDENEEESSRARARARGESPPENGGLKKKNATSIHSKNATL